MTSRHVFTQRLKSGVIFSAPGNMLAMPEGGWGDDTPMNRSKKPKKKVKNRGLGQFSHWVAKVTPYDEPYDDISSFTPDRDTRNSEYRPYSIPPYPEPPVRPAEAENPEVTLCLPMLSVSLTATVDGTVAHTELVQKFHNPSDEIIDAAKHVFPLYDGAVITSFECTIGDERRVRGVVKPKAQARKEFEEAVRDRVAAPALLEEHTPEIFETSLGNIPANTTVEINITYVQELKVVMMETEATEGIALTIPMSIAPRYSKSPIEWEPASRVPEEKLDIWIKVMDNGKVNHEGCDEESGYLLQFEGSKPVEYSNMLEKDTSARTYYVWHHASEPPALRKDFVFVIPMNEDHQIKSGAIACAADDKGLAAMRVNIRPNDLFRNAIIPQSFTGEILFLLDQSGSMGWSNGSPGYGRRRTGGRKIDVMREAMLLALSGIPSTCIFNIISWGSATVGLWENSQPHTQENIREAKSYVSQMEADMGGTDLLRALEAVVKRRVQERESTQIIVLTDGELEPEDSIQFIWKKRQLFGDKVRFFALGIGDEVSHRLVESIAECGGGYSDVVHTTQTPRWHDRLNRLLKSALEPNSWSCDIDLGSGFERKNLVDYNLGQDTPADGSNIPYIQAPFPISSLHPFSFAPISFLIDLRHGGAIPKTVTINTTTPGAKRKTYELPIEISSGRDGTIHRLVAKSLLLDLQDQIKRGVTETEVAKTNAETIGTMYSITSKWTSFVAVSENQPTQAVEEQKMNHYKALFDEIDIDELLNNVDDDESTTSGSLLEMVGGVSQGPGMNSLDLSPPSGGFSGPPGHFSYGQQLESVKPILITVPMPKRRRPPPPTVRRSNTKCRPSVSSGHTIKLSSPKKSIARNYVHPMPQPIRHPQPAPDPKAELSGNNIPLVSGQRVTCPLNMTRSSSHQSMEAHSRRWRDSHASDESANQTQTFGNVADLTTLQAAGHGSLSDKDRLADFPLHPADSAFEKAEVLERTRADTGDGVPKYIVSHSTPPAAQDSPIHELRDDTPADTAKPGGVEAFAQAVACKRASRSSYHLPFKPIGSRKARLPNDYAYTYSSDDDDIAQDYRPQHAVQSASSSKLPSSDENDQIPKPANTMLTAAFYKPPMLHRHVPRPKSSFSFERMSSIMRRRQKAAKEEVADEPMVQPSADRGFAIPAAVMKPEEPHVSNDDDTGQKRVAFEEIEVSERSLSLADTSDGVTPHSVSDSPTVEDPSLHQPRRPPLDRKSRTPTIVTTYRKPPVLGASQNVSSSRHSPDNRNRQIHGSDVPPSSNEPCSPGWTPQNVTRALRPGGPKYPTYRAMPIPNPGVHPYPSSRAPFASQPSNVQSWDSDDDSDYDLNSVGSRESTSPQLKIHGPLHWQFAMECQYGLGLFDLSGKKQYLHLHFCPETATKIGPKISELLHNSPTPEQDRDDISARLLDTLMMIECYKTHRAQDEDIWDLMMERAWDAVVSVLGLSYEEEALEELAGQLRGAMMHAHYIAATAIKDSEKDDHSVETVRCPACDVVWRTTRQFWCPFDHESDNEVDEFLNWDDFWKHQVGQGHVVCTQEVMY
ncbi:hypothetical protein ACKLNR_004631 [Fusarium oxysporum f. sp. zingiberi]